MGFHNSPIQLIGCRGGKKEAPRLLEAEGWHYGFRSDYKAYGWPYFIDINWKSYRWDKHLAVVNRWRPVQAMVADYLSKDQKETMLAQVSDIRAMGVRPMVCPKFLGAVVDIPPDCIVAVSVPTSSDVYAGFLPPEKELVGRDLHLLGGHPDQFAVLIERFSSSRVVSIDCSAIFQKAIYGAFWSARKSTWRYVKHRYSTNVLIRMSARNVRRYLDAPSSHSKERKRLENIGFRKQPYLFGIDMVTGAGLVQAGHGSKTKERL
jgi:hypothetical protein